MFQSRDHAVGIGICLIRPPAHWPDPPLMIRWLPAVAVLCLLIAACSSAAPTTPAIVSPTPTGAATLLPSASNNTLGRPTATAVPQPTPHTDATDWVKERLDAVIALYQPTEAGEALLRSLDLRQMEGEPGFFGSYGFGKWAGVGEARPIGAMRRADGAHQHVQKEQAPRDVPASQVTRRGAPP